MTGPGSEQPGAGAEGAGERYVVRPAEEVVPEEGAEVPPDADLVAIPVAQIEDELDELTQTPPVEDDETGGTGAG